ncbi:hypothetical protein PpBr36_05548 [Pyricularia pennisetigena]|uniref:hypothetical protein n=1 Tax=Pyricularia pennisetigena TaxID=1578925 RepID=UPI001151C88D|nr:hypothetical protein PpBr36_05548 [Pyricularia pennisetigena]TLS27099.1 hypothetical protein PpBr36_05548 [Pyricularia pennisetigena]
MGGRGSGPRLRGVPPRKPPGRTRSSGTPIDPWGPPVYHDIARVLYPATATGLPSNDPESEDPMFDLQDATVFRQDGKTMANLLEVAVDGPFIVKGKMIVEQDTEDRLAIPRCKSVYVVIPKCSMFSMGYGPLTLWAWSVGGWMEIKPAKVYRETYFNMFEAITLYWEIMAAYQDLEHKFRKKSKSAIRQALLNARLDEIFYQYAKNAGDGVILSEVEKRCDKHALFLLDQFDQQSDFDWDRTSFFHWMRKRHPDIVAKLEAQKTKNAATKTSSRTRVSVDIEMSGTKHTRPEPSKPLPAVPPPSGPLSTIRAPASTPVSTHISSTAVKHGLIKNPPATNLPTIITLLEEIAAEAEGGRKSTYGKFTSEMYKKCKLSNTAYSIPKEILQLYAADILKTLDPEQWKGSPLWEGLEKEAKQPITKLVHLQSMEEIAERLVRRQHRTIVSVEEVATPSRVPNRSHAGKTPRLSLSVARKRPLEEMDLDDDGEVSVEPSPAGPSSIGPGLIGTNAAPPRRRGRPPKISRAERAQIPQDQSTGNTDDESSDESDSGIGGTATKVVLRSYPLQTEKPTGPMGTWVCSEAGCGHIVRSAKDIGQRKKVLEHMQLHTKHDMELAEQAREEGQRNGLPVSKLLDKIMKDAANKSERIKRAQLGW